jgi:hypothetical protein
LIIRSGLYDNARTTDFLMQWQTTGCLASILFHSPWAPVPFTNYTQWRSSVENLWRNTGNRDTVDLPAGDAIIRICDSVSDYKAGVGPAPGDTPESLTEPALLPCPNIPKESSWISYDVEVTFHEVRHDSSLRRMVNSFTKSASSILQGMGAPLTTSISQQLSTLFDKDPAKHDIQSQNGRPQQFILIRAKGRRVNHKPTFPTLETVGGVKVTAVTGAEYTTSVVAKFGNCAILAMKGYQWYKADDPISDYNPKDNPVFCATTQESSPDV